MNKILSATLLFLYLIPAIGVNVSVHYCGGEFASFTINGIGKSEKCACGSERVKKKCCEDKELSFALTDDQYKTPKLAYNWIELLSYSTPIVHVASTHQHYFVAHIFSHSLHPPDYIKQPLYILNQVFRI